MQETVSLFYIFGNYKEILKEKFLFTKDYLTNVMTNFLMDKDIYKVLMPIQKMIDRDFEKKLNDKFEKFEMEAPWPEDFGVRREFSLTQATVEYIREKQDRWGNCIFG